MDLLDSAAHNAVAKNKSELDVESFALIFNARGVSGRMWRIIAKRGDNAVTPEELANSLQEMAKKLFYISIIVLL